ncbi:SCO2525 family SAM-dependent methyltransferase [Actinoplanes sp. TRM 88003]|uniref:SCO2525 family SAM-dependent methyltransferase n=1 Tax=Paractinoplanes aksuensis TaxID=2939490 RepID=A0ABT1DX06_9ACTN|nr:SCO2525 family SAM-dependent methyltransferase [Actinoplanes aksuensis]MCO8275401.1 SCO2525 family SAM-dependent methyltransferase [Actinoplanes aksuensis]
MKQQRTVTRVVKRSSSTPEQAPAAPDWDAFEPHTYWKHNYAFFRGDDQRFLRLVRDFFGDQPAPTDTRRIGIDVGSGANLYPALAMLPLCDEITLLEYGAQNYAWLEDQVRRYSTRWDPFWRMLREHPTYAKYARHPRARLASMGRPLRGSLFDLADQPARYHVGTMFFVAESITDDPDEFRRAMDAFLGSLLPGAPFAAAFMRNSTGYRVAAEEYPAFRVDEDGISEYLESKADVRLIVAVDKRGQFINADNVPDTVPTWGLRDDYDGMILALGHAR